jgi:oligopeptide/dipeptide ABC transporter ATP-binding protein
MSTQPRKGGGQADPADGGARKGEVARPLPTDQLQVDNLRIETLGGVEIVDEVTFSVPIGKVLALVGESGCGKTSIAMALLGHARAGTRIAGGSVWLNGRDVLKLNPRELREVRGAEISYVAQDPTANLSPRRTIGSQMVEAMTIHGQSKAESIVRARKLIGRVQLPDADEFMNRYPFELSGGQQQRALIAIALSCSPTVLVLDEPTTGLDVTTQARVLEVLTELAQVESVAFVYVTHDLAVVDHLADNVAVMYSGRLVEIGDRHQIFGRPEHPYTNLLLDSVPRIRRRHLLTGIPGTAAAPGERPEGCFFRTRCPLAASECADAFPPRTPNRSGGYVRCYRLGVLAAAEPESVERSFEQHDTPLLEVVNLVASYGRQTARSAAVHDLSLSIYPGECVALAGESGSGKTTTGRCIAGLHAPDQGEIRLRGEALAPHASQRTRWQLRAVQIVFQNPDRSLNPSHTVRKIIERPIKLLGNVDGASTAPRLLYLIDRVRLPKRKLDLYPGELSGGEKQRVAIARALAAEPVVLVCDEVTSALDVSIQAAIVELLEELRDGGLAMLFITHNLGVVSSIANRTLVMQNGRLMEEGDTRQIIDRPRNPYTRALVAAAPDLQSR